MNRHSGIRALHDLPLDGPTNMARDEALMTLVGMSLSPPTLRLYQWDRPTISLGYFQRFEDYLAIPFPARELPVVRRLTGGGAILHDLELTYSIALPAGHVLLRHGVHRLYEIAHDAVIGSLASLGISAVRCGASDGSGGAKGPFFCFQRRHRYDVLFGDAKIAGSAQRRTRSAVLQHGSIILGNRCAQQPTAVIDRPFEESMRRARSEMVVEFARILGTALEPGQWSAGELSAAAALHGKYASADWTTRA